MVCYDEVIVTIESKPENPDQNHKSPETLLWGKYVDDIEGLLVWPIPSQPEEIQGLDLVPDLVPDIVDAYSSDTGATSTGEIEEELTWRNPGESRRPARLERLGKKGKLRKRMLGVVGLFLVTSGVWTGRALTEANDLALEEGKQDYTFGDAWNDVYPRKGQNTQANGKILERMHIEGEDGTWTAEEQGLNTAVGALSALSLFYITGRGGKEILDKMSHKELKKLKEQKTKSPES